MNETQVARGRLAFDDDVAAVVVDLNLAFIDPDFRGDDLLDEIGIAVGERLDGAPDLRLDNPPICNTPERRVSRSRRTAWKGVRCSYRVLRSAESTVM